MCLIEWNTGDYFLNDSSNIYILAPTLCDTAPSLYGTKKTVHSLYGVVEYECNPDFRFLDDTFVKRVPCPCNHDWNFLDNLWASTDGEI